jgi:photolyase PhrII
VEIDALPEHLAERTRAIGDGGERAAGELVLYWMHHAVRADENPALDVARTIAHDAGLPLLVYQGLGGRHPFNSDRHHTFIMEGARDVQAALETRGIRHVFHMPRSASESRPLTALALRAAQVVTEDFPAPPFPRWCDTLARRIEAPLWAVDTACVLPMGVVGRRFERAYAFREHTQAARDRRVSRAWPSIDATPARFEGSLGFDDIPLADADLAALCADCDIDHGVAPVPDTRGGSTAGYQRWETFRHTGLTDYDKLRNDPTIAWPRGASRLSPYLHHGHVSPLRIAREAAARPSSGARKFLDELLIWRELAHNFCFYTDDVESLGALPVWARETLDAHRADERGAHYSWERLARATTGDALWDAAQRALLVHGELHNNLRMTWGKAFIEWTATPERALELMIDLNHRYALDGSDPNSYGGLLYCLGLFDRAFQPERPVAGTIRARPTAQHAKRMNVARYSERIVRRDAGASPRVAVIGAGIAGLTTARTLLDHGIEVCVFERSRSVGGRAATRRVDEFNFDHGAQYFTARSESFRRHLQAWLEEGRVARWSARIVKLNHSGMVTESEAAERFVAVPGASALARHLATDLDVRTGCEVAGAVRTDAGWRLSDSANADLGAFDVLLVAMTPEQCMPLLAECEALATPVREVQSSPCWALMAAFPQRLAVDFDAAFVEGSPLAWIARNASKPGRPDAECWVAHASTEWSQAHLEDEAEAVAAELLQALLRVTNAWSIEPVYIAAHRWRLARVLAPHREHCLWDGDARVGVCGDWLVESRIEGAYASGVALAGRVLASARDWRIPARGDAATPAQGELFESPQDTD